MNQLATIVWAALGLLAFSAPCAWAGIIREHYPAQHRQFTESLAAAAAADAADNDGHHQQQPQLIAASSKHEHKHAVKHEHATSHQSFKIHHYHAVPVYVKKEHQHLLKHPVSIGGVKHKLKQVHPEAHKSHHGHGLVLENLLHHKGHEGKLKAPQHTPQQQSHGPQDSVGVKQAAEQIAHLHDYGQLLEAAKQSVLSDEVPHRFHDINVRSGGHGQ